MPIHSLAFHLIDFLPSSICTTVETTLVWEEKKTCRKKMYSLSALQVLNSHAGNSENKSAPCLKRCERCIFKFSCSFTHSTAIWMLEKLDGLLLAKDINDLAHGFFPRHRNRGWKPSGNSSHALRLLNFPLFSFSLSPPSPLLTLFSAANGMGQI